jgi:predicted AlkP superfamily phosphohydrolase/phosphomutase
VNLNCLLAEAGFLHLRPSARPAFTDLTAETTAFAMDPGRIYLHRQGRYPAGKVSVEEADTLLERLTRFFLDITVDGQPVAASVYRGRDVYSGPFAHRAPDLIVMPSDDTALSGRLNTSQLIEPTLINGKHTFEESTFFVRGTDAAKRIPADMKVEHVLDVIRPREAAAQRRAA